MDMIAKHNAEVDAKRKQPEPLAYEPDMRQLEQRLPEQR